MGDVANRQLDPELLAAWHEQHAGRMKAFVWGLVRNADLADDIVQITFTKALTHGVSIKPGSEKAWLFQVAYRESMRVLRREVVHQRAISRTGTHESAENPYSDLIQEEVRERVLGALATLPEEQQVVVAERIYEGRSFQEIADRHALPLGTVTTRMRLALEKLRQSLKPNR